MGSSEGELRKALQDSFPGGSVVKNPPAKAGCAGLIPDPGRSHMPWSNYEHVPQLLSWALQPGATTAEARVL